MFKFVREFLTGALVRRRPDVAHEGSGHSADELAVQIEAQLAMANSGPPSCWSIKTQTLILGYIACVAEQTVKHARLDAANAMSLQIAIAEIVLARDYSSEEGVSQIIALSHVRDPSYLVGFRAAELDMHRWQQSRPMLHLVAALEREKCPDQQEWGVL